MTALQWISGLAGAVLSLTYFWAFRRMIRWSLGSGHNGRLALVLGLGLRQVILAASIVMLWSLGLPWQGLLVGLAIGSIASRVLLVRSTAER